MIRSPSAVSSTPAPRPVELGASAASRSVSWPRMWATPRMTLGLSARAHRAATTGVSSLESCRSTSMPEMLPPPLTVRPARSSTTSPPIMSSTSRMKSPPWVVYCGQPGTCTRPSVTRAAARNCAALDRSGSTCTSRALTSLGSTRQVCRSPSSTTTPASRSVSTVISMCGRLGTALPSWCTVTPSSKRGAGQQQPGDELRGGRGVEGDGTAAHRPHAVHGERQAAAAVVVDLDAEGAQRPEHRCHRALPGVRVTVEAHRPVREPGHRWHEAHHVAGEPAVDRAAADQPAGCHQPVTVVDVVDHGAERAQRLRP